MIKLYTHITLAVIGLVSLLASCNMVNPSEKLPTYLKIDSVKLLPTDANKHGSISHKITDVWVYYNREIIGAFELPARVPILAEGNGQVQILAGIYKDGLSTTRAKYPFYTVDTFSFTASPANTITHIPMFNYRTTDTPNVTYYKEDFEQGNLFEKRYTGSDTTIVRTNAIGDVFEEDWSGLIYFNDTANYVECITTQSYYLPAYRDSYLELNYKSDVPFKLKMAIVQQGNNIETDIIGLKARTDWTKAYIDLSGFAKAFPNASFRLVIEANKTSTLTTAKVLIDNFKIIYFN